MKNTITVIFIFCLLLGVPSLAEATTRADGAAFLVEKGEAALHSGNKEEALKIFSKALMLDHNNPVALKHLKALGVPDGLYAPEEGHGAPLQQMSEKVKIYEEQLAQLQKEKKSLEKKFQAMETEYKSLMTANQAQDKRIQELFLMAEAMGAISFDVKEAEPVLESPVLSQHRMIFETDSVDPHPSYTAKVVPVMEEYIELHEQSLNDAQDAEILKEIALLHTEDLLLKKIDQLIELK